MEKTMYVQCDYSWLFSSTKVDCVRKKNRQTQALLDLQIPGQEILDFHASFVLIVSDIPRTFPENPFFQVEKTTEDNLLGPLRNILFAFVAHNPDVGYCQGVNYIGAVILLVVQDEEKSFWLLDTLVMKIVSKSYYTTSLIGLERDCFVLNEIIK